MRIDQRRPRGAAYLVAIFALLPLAACGGGGTDGGGGPAILPLPSGGASGKVSFVRAASSVSIEAEPNDDVTAAQRLPDAFAGDFSSVIGELDLPGGDAVDAFRRRFPMRVDVTVSLAYSPGRDFALALYDPLSMQFLRTATGATPELTFRAHGQVDIVVIANSGGGSYELTFQTDPPAPELAELEPNDTATSGQVLGELRLGENMIVTGDAFAGADAMDAFLVSCPQDAQIGLRLTIAAFTSSVLHVSDATGGLASPAPLTTITAPASEPRVGTVAVSAGTLLLVEIEAQTSGGIWRLELTSSSGGGSPKPGAAGGVFVQAPPSQVAHVAHESHWFRRAPQYGVLTGEICTGEALVCFCPGQEAEATEAAATRGCVVKHDSPRVCLMSFDLPPGQDEADHARQTFARCCALGGEGCVQYAEPNGIRRPFATPDDPHYTLQSWHYEQLNLPNAWDIQTGSSDVIVAVIDTGRLNHPDLDARQIAGYDFVTTQYAGDGDGVDPNPDDHGVQTSYHGGHVAGTIGAVSDNSLGVAGVTWAGRIMPLRALGDFGVGTDFDIANAIDYAAGRPNSSGTLPAERADIINMSLGGGGFSQTTNNACQNAKDTGLVVLAAAGNNNSSTPSYPAAYASVISVVALDARRARARYSNFGPTVTISAPGGDTSADANGDGYGDGVLSTSRTAANGPVYTFLNGTSMACPHAAGVAALIISQDPSLTPGEVEAVLTSTAVDLGAVGRDDQFGHGLIDANAALLSLATVVPPPPTPAELEVSPQVINFGTNRTENSVVLRNLGQDPLDVTTIDVTTEDGGAWLTAILTGTGTPTQNVDGADVFVNRGGLAPGNYFGKLLFRSNGGDVEVTVLMQVVTAPPPPPDIDIFVRAISADTGLVVQERVVNPAVTLDYTFASLSIGSYVFVAGTDIDGDGVICEEGDFCGEYPLQGQPRTVQVNRDFVVTRLDFEVIRPGSVFAKPTK